MTAFSSSPVYHRVLTEAFDCPHLLLEVRTTIIMAILVETKALLAYLGYMDQTRLCGSVINVLLRTICLASLSFIAIPSLLYICFLVQSFSDGIEATVAVISASTNFVLYSILLWYRPRILHLIACFEAKIAERV